MYDCLDILPATPPRRDAPLPAAGPASEASRLNRKNGGSVWGTPVPSRLPLEACEEAGDLFGRTIYPLARR